MSSGSAEGEPEKFLKEFFARQMEFSTVMNGPLDDLRRARRSAEHLVTQLKEPAVRKALLEYLQE